jgi:hypothetical protein
MRNGNTQHALLMDFRIAKSSESLLQVVAACEGIGRAGWLLETTHSYHFYGDELVDEREWLRFMGRWLLLESVADVRFVGHCIIEWISCLRLTGSRNLGEPVALTHIAGR